MRVCDVTDRFRHLAKLNPVMAQNCFALDLNWLRGMNPKDAYEAVRARIAQLTSNAPPEAVCKSGCNACCYQAVTVTIEEAKHLARHLKPGDIEQLQAQKNFSDWEPFDERSRCVFLRDGKCSIYKDRPLSCRLVYGTEPDKCGYPLEQKIPVKPRAESLLSAYWSLSYLKPMHQALLEIIQE